MPNFYKGDEIKFAITLEAPGFDMDTDDFDIEVKSVNTSVKGYKTPPAGTSVQGLVIFKETPEPQDGGEGEEGDGETTPAGQWYAIVDTSTLAIGTMRVVATAHIVDANANDGVRNNIDVKQLGKLLDP